MIDPEANGGGFRANLDGMGMNDEISSAFIPKGYYVMLFGDSDYRDFESILHHGNYTYLPFDHISSLKVYKKNVAPADDHTAYLCHGEWCQGFGIGTYHYLGDAGNDDANELHLPKGLRVNLYAHHGKGFKLNDKWIECKTPNMSDGRCNINLAEFGWADKVSSIEVSSGTDVLETVKLVPKKPMMGEEVDVKPNPGYSLLTPNFGDKPIPIPGIKYSLTTGKAVSTNLEKTDIESSGWTNTTSVTVAAEAGGTIKAVKVGGSVEVSNAFAYSKNSTTSILSGKAEKASSATEISGECPSGKTLKPGEVGRWSIESKRDKIEFDIYMVYKNDFTGKIKERKQEGKEVLYTSQTNGTCKLLVDSPFNIGARYVHQHDQTGKVNYRTTNGNWTAVLPGTFFITELRLGNLTDVADLNKMMIEFSYTPAEGQPSQKEAKPLIDMATKQPSGAYIVNINRFAHTLAVYHKDKKPFNPEAFEIWGNETIFNKDFAVER